MGDFRLPLQGRWGSATLWTITQRVVVIYWRRFGTTYWSQLQGSIIRSVLDSWPLQTGPTGCPQTSVWNYHYSLRNKPEERNSHLLHGRSLKSPIVHVYWKVTLRYDQRFERCFRFLTIEDGADRFSRNVCKKFNNYSLRNNLEQRISVSHRSYMIPKTDFTVTANYKGREDTI